MVVSAEWLKPIQVLVVDWDGTLLDSMAAKEEAFDFAVLKWFEDSSQGTSQNIRALYRKHSGHPRDQVVRRIGIDLGQSWSADDILTICRDVGAASMRVLAAAELFPDAIELLRKALATQRKVYISSSVPQAELEDIVARKLPADTLDKVAMLLGTGVFGTKGIEHDRAIALASGVSRERMLAIGDDLADVELHAAAGIACILVDREARFFGHANSVTSLQTVADLLS